MLSSPNSIRVPIDLKMKLFTGIVASYAIAIADAKSSCLRTRWQDAQRGGSIGCESNEILTGICASGRYNDCPNGTWKAASYEVGCCQVRDARRSGCTEVRKGYGKEAECPDDKPFGTKGCASGKYADCRNTGGSKVHHELTCCAFEKVEMTLEGCKKIYAKHGKRASCPTGYALHGQCTSGQYRDCSGASHWIQCCPFLADADKPKIVKVEFNVDEAKLIFGRVIILTHQKMVSDFFK